MFVSNHLYNAVQTFVIAGKLISRQPPSEHTNRKIILNFLAF